MYNSIYPININYSKHPQYGKNSAGSNSPVKQSIDSNEQSNNQNNTFPNGTKVAIDYTKNQINISQVLTDFRSTILAINAPEDVRDEVYVYLGLVEKESKKENPSRDIIVANLKNASKISDAFIASALNKPSNVVEKWIETLFLQKINLKADPNEINPDFQLEFPQGAKERIEAQKQEEITISKIDNNDNDDAIDSVDEEQLPIQNVQAQGEVSLELASAVVADENIEVDEAQEAEKTVLVSQKTPLVSSLFAPNSQYDTQAKELFIQAKNLRGDNKSDAQAVNLLNEALGLISLDESSNENIRAAIHIERGKIFDSYDYVEYALRDYFEATKATDYNLKAQAYYKSGQIYDEFSEFYPAVDNYFSSVVYSGEAENVDAQTRVLSKIAQLYARQYDAKNALDYGELAIESAISSNNPDLIAQTYSQDAQNSQYLGENERAIDSYKEALSVFSRNDETYEQTAYNYEQAAIVMRKLGNHAKAAKLQLKANQYYQKAQQHQMQLEEAS